MTEREIIAAYRSLFFGLVDIMIEGYLSFGLKAEPKILRSGCAAEGRFER